MVITRTKLGAKNNTVSIIKTLSELEDSGVLELGRGQIISKTDLLETPGIYPVYSSSAQGIGEFGQYGKYLFDEEMITWSVDGGGRFFYRPMHKFSVTNVSGWLRIQNKELLNAVRANPSSWRKAVKRRMNSQLKAVSAQNRAVMS